MRTNALLKVVRLGIGACLALAAVAGARAVTINITYTDPAGTGFNDPVLGAQRRHCLETAANVWAVRLQGNVTIETTASMPSMGGTALSAILGSCSARYSIWNWTGAPVMDVRYPAALANELAGSDLQPSYPDIVAQFNSDVDNSTVLGNINFYYGTDGQAGRNIDFFHTCVHEFGHGLGFFSVISQQGFWNGGSTYPPALFDTYLTTSPTATTPQITAMTQGPTVASALVSNSLYFAGPATRAALNGTNARLFAPSPYQPGSSVSHLDENSYRGTSAVADINELMTPYAGPGAAHYPGPIVTAMFKDIGWSLIPFTVPDAALALRAAAGLTTLSDGDVARLNTDDIVHFPSRVTIADAMRIVRGVGGTDMNPYPGP